MTYAPKTAANFVGNRQGFLLYGPPGSGKTVCAASISEFFPDELPAAQPTLVRDVYYLQFDPDGMQSLLSLRLDAPGRDLSACTTKETLGRGLIEAVMEIKEGIKEGIIKAVVVDTLTAFDSVLLSIGKKDFPSTADQARMYGWILQEQMQFGTLLKQLPIHLITTCHSKFVFNPSKDDTGFEMRKRAFSLPGQSDIVPELTGRGANYWKGVASNVWPLISYRQKGQKPRFTVLPYGGKGFEGKSRLGGLDEEEPANLRKALIKAAKNVAQTEVKQS